MAGPTNGSASGAFSSRATSFATRSIAARITLSSGNPPSSTASKVSNEATSVPSAALAPALITRRANPRPCATRVPSEFTRYRVSVWQITETCEVSTLG